MHLPENTVLQGGRYVIKRFISSGGFGCTYEAEHTLLEKCVAIKEFFVKDFCNRDEATAHVTIGTQSKKTLVEKLKNKFIDEAKALCKLQHPGIVRVFDVFEENGTAYYVMDYVDGLSLSGVLKQRGTLTEAEALGYIRQVCSALKYVHGNYRLHLDIKPGNIMVDANGNAILIDFGASKQYDEANGENTSTLMGT
ncbi:MAG: serine/threonine protein kinase, partial [Bacteroidaceae bacterium]|nr:serine/threonine protein kinase [Bacteroidaceae bacterium]